MAGIKIQFLADVRDFLRGTSDAEDALEDVADALDDVATDALKAGKDAGDNLAEGIEAGVVEVDGSMEKLERSFKDALDDVGTKSKKAGDDLSHNLKTSTLDVADSAKEMGDEIKSEAIEGAASFDGSMQSVQDSAQSLAANILQAFGPLGVGIGVAAAAGLGYFRAQAEKMKTAVSELATALVQDQGKLSRDSILSKVQEFVQDGSITKLAAQANAAKIPVGDFILAMAGDPDALDRSSTAIKDYQEALAASVQGQDVGDFTQDSVDMANALAEASGKLDTQREALGAASEAYNVYADATREGADGSATFAEGMADAEASIANNAASIDEAVASYEDLAAALDASVDPLAVYNEALGTGKEKAKVTIDTMIKDLDKKISSNKSFEKNLKTLATKGMDEGLINELRSKGPDAAGAVTSVLAKGTDEKVKEYSRKHGVAVGGAVGSGITKGIADTDLSVGVNSSINAAEETMRRKGASLNVPTKTDPAAFMRDLQNGVNRGSIFVDVKPRSGSGN